MYERKNELRNIVISFKSDNQGSIVLAHNSDFHTRIKYIDIQHHYIYDKAVAHRIQLLYISINEMMADNLTKAMIYDIFYCFVK